MLRGGVHEEDREMEFLQNEIFNATTPLSEQHCLHLYHHQRYHQTNGGVAAAVVDNASRSSPYFTPFPPPRPFPSSNASVNYTPPSSSGIESETLWEKFQTLDIHDGGGGGGNLWKNAPVTNPCRGGDSNLHFTWVPESGEDHRLPNHHHHHHPLPNTVPYEPHRDIASTSSGGAASRFHLPIFSNSLPHNDDMMMSRLSILTRHGHGRNINGFTGEDSFIIQGNDLQYIASRAWERGRSNVDELCGGGGGGGIRPPRIALFRPVKYDSLANLRGCIYLVAKDQQGCRFLQRKFDERRPEDIQMIFKELIGHIAELMVNPFANYLMQKLFDVCTEDQRQRVVLMLTRHPFELVKVSLNNHGTRAVQRLIETLTTQQQIESIVNVLRPGYLILIKDLNGHHVILRCLHCLSMDDNKYIFVAAADNCVEIASDQHGCCVLQRCLFHSNGPYQSNLIMQIVNNGFHLAQHPFGNYAVQFVMEMNNPLANRKLMSRYNGNYVELSTNKFGSNVVEKCLRMWEDARDSIIVELLSAPQFDMLLQDQYGNYVIQCALVNSKGCIQNTLIEAIRPYEPVLRTNPYCKKIFSRPCFRR